MKNIPRILPLVGVAIGGVLALNALAGARGLPNLMSGARAFAEEAAKTPKTPKGSKAKADDKAGADAAKAADPAATGQAIDAAASILPPPTLKPQAVCAPTAAELAKEAGLSPAELQVLQSLGARRGQLDQREADLSTQLGLMAAAEAKLDAKVQALNALKADIQGLVTQTDGREAAEIDRLVKVFEGMKPRDAAPRLVLLDDNVRVPIAAKMKDRALAAVMAQMPPTDAKKLTEALARRFSAARTLAANAQNVANQAATRTGAPQTAASDKTAKPVAKARRTGKQARKAAPRKAAPADAQAATAPAPAKPTAG
jgi:flagellar motility protein MotE (MotC chaperone)